MAFVSTLFPPATAEAFDRKRSEVSSLHTLSKLVTQVFDFNELVDKCDVDDPAGGGSLELLAGDQSPGPVRRTLLRPGRMPPTGCRWRR